MNDAQKQQITGHLAGLAKKKALTGYLKLNEKLKLGLDFSSESQMEELYAALDEISQQSFNESKVLLGILVVNKMRNRPSSRCFAGIEKIIGTKITDTDSFYIDQRDKVYERYAG